ncbi:MAG TPA: peptide MFS transporter [Sphingobacterium sp.]|nr:peptide MFS transporter [Sphingobacterium sp.]
MANTVEIEQRKEIFGHPIGLYILFFTEMWERFSYYGMRGILVLYIVASASGADPGMGWTYKDALGLYAIYTMAVYVASIPGGWIADKFLGQKKTVMLGGLLLVVGHGILAISQEWAFFSGLVLIVLGVGGLKPNISTMVGGLYEPGDPRRDSGFTIFYIGINIGALLAGIIVGLVAHYYGWHYGFGLAGIGMLIGQIVYISGQKYLKGVGDFVGAAEASVEQKEAANRPLTKVEKDRIGVLLISFLIIIVFWGAFEQAGGLMNLYTDTKINRHIGGASGWEVPAAVFQSLNSAYIIIFGTLIGGFWIWWKKKGKESSSLFKMALGTIIMGLGFIFMVFAAKEAAAEHFGKAALVWIFLAYLFHTIGELCTSPVALSFITKLAPVKYASLLMGLYFAATGFGDYLAGYVGSLSQLNPYSGKVITEKSEITPFLKKEEIEIFDATGKAIKVEDYPINQDKYFEIKSKVYLEGSELHFEEYTTRNNITGLFQLDKETVDELKETLHKNKAGKTTPYHARLDFEKDREAISNENTGDGKDYIVKFVLEEEQDALEYKTFMWITIFTVSFGLLLLLFLKKLKKLTHGAEEIEDNTLEAEGFEISSNKIRE